MRTEKDFEKYLDTIKQCAAEEGYDSLDETFVKHLKCRFSGQDVVIGETARIILREIKMSDLEAFYGFEDAYTEPVLRAFIKESPEASKKYLKAYIEHMYPMFDYGFWTVLEKQSGEIIGICGLGQAECQGAECTDLGYYICPKWRKQGIASECIEFVLDYAKNYLEFPLIYAIIKEENRISAGILRKFSFECLDRFDGKIVYCKKLAE
ncbi:MAG: GNAT family N-acetyltransferase [Lachnospiraceae bacterium]|nr:GNAT family N-acetyltransferase [Lachnospiraceae bacterium]